MTTSDSFGPWLKEKRRLLDLTQVEIADRLGCSEDFYAKIETGRRRPSKQLAGLIAGVLGIAPDRRDQFLLFARGLGRFSEGSTPRAQDMRDTAAEGSRPYINLPAPPTAFIGRVREQLEIQRLLSRPGLRLLTLVGPPGTGKTRLALQVAADLAQEFRDGVVFVPLAPIGQPDLVIPVIASAMGAKEAPGQALLDSVKSELRDRQTLIVLDNFEHVLGASPVVSEMLLSSPGLTVLATSREALDLYGEHIFPVPPLEWPEEGPPIWPRHLSRYDAIALFVERAQAAWSAFRLDADNSPAIIEICRRLEGLPLAIELAAGRTRSLSLPDMLSMLDNKLDLLSGGPRDLPARQQTLRGALEWSHNLLDEGARVLFRRLAAFPGGCTDRTAQAVCGFGRLDSRSVAQCIEALVNANLLQRAEAQEAGTAAGPRFGMLEMIREFALDKLHASGEAETLSYRHALYFMTLAESAYPHLAGADQDKWLAILNREQANFYAALHWCLEEEQGAQIEAEARKSDRPTADAGPHPAEVGVRLVTAMWRAWYVQGRLPEAERWLNLAVGLTEGGADNNTPTGENGSPAAPPGDNSVSSRARALLLLAASSAARLKSDYDTSSRYGSLGLALFETIGDKEGTARAYYDLAQSRRHKGDFQGALELHERSLALYREIGDKYWVAASLDSMATIKHALGKTDAVRSLFEEALQIFQELDNKHAAAIVTGNLGALSYRDGDYPAAYAYNSQALKMQRGLDDRLGMAHTLSNLAGAAYRMEDYRQAACALQESVRLLVELGATQVTAFCLPIVASLLGSVGFTYEAARLFGASESMSKSRDETQLKEWRCNVETARAHAWQLDEQAWDRSWAQGAQMTAGEALAYSLEQLEKALAAFPTTRQAAG